MHSHRCMKIMTPPEGGCHPITIIVTLICCSSMRRCIWQLKLHRGCTQEREGAYCLFETQPPTEPTMVYTACSNFRNTLKSPQLLCVVHLRVSWCCTFPPKNSHFQLCDFEIPPIMSFNSSMSSFISVFGWFLWHCMIRKGRASSNIRRRKKFHSRKLWLKSTHIEINQRAFITKTIGERLKLKCNDNYNSINVWLGLALYKT